MGTITIRPLSGSSYCRPKDRDKRTWVMTYCFGTLSVGYLDKIPAMRWLMMPFLLLKIVAIKRAEKLVNAVLRKLSQQLCRIQTTIKRVDKRYSVRILYLYGWLNLSTIMEGSCPCYFPKAFLWETKASVRAADITFGRDCGRPLGLGVFSTIPMGVKEIFRLL